MYTIAQLSSKLDELVADNTSLKKKLSEMNERIEKLAFTRYADQQGCKEEDRAYLHALIREAYGIDSDNVFYKNDSTNALKSSRNRSQNSDEMIARYVLYYLLNRLLRVPLRKISELYGFEKPSYCVSYVETRIIPNAVEKTIIDDIQYSFESYVFSKQEF
jgi:hypothetical protein